MNVCSVKMTREDQTSADSKHLGFEYQYMCFIRQLLKIRSGEEVGYEYHDDVHTVSSDGITTYIQVKHTTETSSDGSQANLTELSPDVWKTFSNWSKLICDPSVERDSTLAQLEFLKQSHFVLWVNRKIKQTSLTSLLFEAKEGTLTTKIARDKLRSIKKSTSDTTLKKYIQDVLELKGQVLLAFLKNTRIESSITQIFDEIRTLIREKMVQSEYVDEILSNLYFQLKEDFFDKVEAKQHQIITYNQWMTKYSSVFNQYRKTLLPIREFNPILPDHLENQFFVTELCELGILDFEDDGLSELAELTRCYLSLELQLNEWYENGKISKLDKDSFHEDVRLTWKRAHQSNHRKTKKNPAVDDENAISCYDELMKEKLQLLSTEIGKFLSNGEFIKLADEQKIGWKYKWKDMYKNAN